jgi:hypothetical protein
MQLDSDIYIDFKKAYDSIRMEVYNILSEPGLPPKPARQSEKCLENL